MTVAVINVTKKAKPPVLIAGAGIGGLSAALALAQQGVQVQIWERRVQLDEVGAGIQLGPNAIRALDQLGVIKALKPMLCHPLGIAVYRAHQRTGQPLTQLPLLDFESRYGHPYATVQRGDLHQVLLQTLRDQPLCQLHLGDAWAGVSAVDGFGNIDFPPSDRLRVQSQTGRALEVSALIGADGLWSQVAQAVAPPHRPQPTGHVAWRGLIDAKDAPSGWDPRLIHVWLAPQCHVVAYSVAGGQRINVVLITQTLIDGDVREWGLTAKGRDPSSGLPMAQPVLQALLAAVMASPNGWLAWVLHAHGPCDLTSLHPVPRADQTPSVQAACRTGRIALLGDAAHPMVPFFAQGAAMALEDAVVLAQCFKAVAPTSPTPWPSVFAAYAKQRAARCAKVQQRSLRNGRIYHLAGLSAWARDLALRGVGPALMDAPWLYGGLGWDA